MAGKGTRHRFELSRLEIAGVIVSATAGLFVVFLLGLYAGRGMVDRRGDGGEQIVRLPVAPAIEQTPAVQAVRRWKPVAFDLLAASRGFGLGAGVLGGFATMLANAAGPVIQLYLMARRVPKMELIGIGARFFLLINLIKVPLNAKLALITDESLLENLKLLPAVAIGIFGGKWLLKYVPQAAFEWMVVVFATLAGLRMIFW